MQFTSPYDEERIVPFLNDRVVQAGETVPVPDHLAEYFVAAGWLPVDEPTNDKTEED